MNDLISRQAAIDALWKALHEYEDKTEQQFQESEELDVADWVQHRTFAQNMSDIDRQTILNLPSAQPEQQWIPVTKPPKAGVRYQVTFESGEVGYADFRNRVFLPDGQGEKMPKIIKPGKKEFIGNCSRCGCEFSYTLEELNAQWPLKFIHCPECNAEYYHPDQSNNYSETLSDYSFEQMVKDSLNVFQQFREKEKERMKRRDE